MLRIDDITYAIAGHRLFESASALIPEGHKVGIVGRNGTGKTTLFRLIRGELPLEGGSISLPARARIGGVAQEVPGSDVSLIDTVLSFDTERADLLEKSSAETDGARIAEIQTRLADIDAWSAEARASAILKGLGFDDAEQQMPCSAFSGGWRMRVALAGVLFAAPDLLLLDEPTNYLDLEGALWLETYLARYPHTVLIISHDRGLLNRAVGAILHLEDRKLTLYQGGYDKFAETRAARLAAAQAQAKKQERAARTCNPMSTASATRPTRRGRRRRGSRRWRGCSPYPRRRRRRCGRFTFPEPEELSPPILRLEGAATGYDGTPVLSRLDLRIDQDDRIALLGRNGEGKSTLSKLLAGKLDVLEGQVHAAARLRVGYFAQHQVDELRVGDTPLDHIRRMRPDETPARLRARLAGFGIGAQQAETVVENLSGGQKARLSLMLATLDSPHMLILDEPTNHLDIESREALVEALTAYTGAIILVSHDMHLLGLVADRLWLVTGGTVTPYEGDLESYRNELLKPPENLKKAAQSRAKKARKPSRDEIARLRQDVRACEARVEKLMEMEGRVAGKLADPDVYEDPGTLATWQRKYAEIEDGIARAESLWEAALSRLEKAGG